MWNGNYFCFEDKIPFEQSQNNTTTELQSQTEVVGKTVKEHMISNIRYTPLPLADGNKTVTWLLCVIYRNCPGDEFVMKVLQFTQRKGNLPSRVQSHWTVRQKFKTHGWRGEKWKTGKWIISTLSMIEHFLSDNRIRDPCKCTFNWFTGIHVGASHTSRTRESGMW